MQALAKSEEDKIDMYTDEQKTLMTFEYFLETSKLIYEVNFISQKRNIEEGIKKRRDLLGKAKNKKENKTSKKLGIEELEEEIEKEHRKEKALLSLIPLTDDVQRWNIIKGGVDVKQINDKIKSIKTKIAE